MPIRLLTEENVELYRELRLKALKEEPEAFGASYEESLQLSEEDMKNRLRCDDYSFVFGYYDQSDALSGMIGFFRRPGLKVKHKGVIWGMYTAPSARGRGVGRALMEALLERARTISGLEELQISVVTENLAATKLYESLGFKTYATEYDALKVNGKYLDELFLSLKL